MVATTYDTEPGPTISHHPGESWTDASPDATRTPHQHHLGRFPPLRENLALADDRDNAESWSCRTAPGSRVARELLGVQRVPFCR